MDLILMQTSDPYRYYDMLVATARTARGFCRRAGVQYQSFVGFKRGNRDFHATYNRIPMLRELIRDGYSGWVLYMDADAWIHDLDFPVHDYLADKGRYAMIGNLARPESTEFWEMNIGVMFFNLGHPFTQDVVEHWSAYLDLYDLAEQAIHWNVEVPDDQGMFHQILDKRYDAAPWVFHESKDVLNSPWATFIRQALRAENVSFEERLRSVQEQVEAVMRPAGGD